MSFSTVQDPLRVGGVPKVQFSRWRKLGIEVAVAKFKIRPFLNWLVGSLNLAMDKFKIGMISNWFTFEVNTYFA